MKKKTLLIGGLAVAVIAAIYMYKKSQTQNTLTVPASDMIPGGYDGSGINQGGIYTKPTEKVLIDKPVVVVSPPVTQPGTSAPATKRIVNRGPVAGLGCYIMS